MDATTEVVGVALNKGGRTRKLFDDAGTYEQLSGLGRLHCTISDVAAFFRVSKSTVELFLHDFPDAKEAYEAGKGEGCISLRRAQFRLAEKHPAMAIFMGKNYLGQSDKVGHEISGPDGEPITIKADRPDYSKLTVPELLQLEDLRGRASAGE
jgi:hypothetical protein